MSAVIEGIRQKYPQYSSIPDDELAKRIGDKYPVYLDNDPAFKKEYEQAQFALSPSANPMAVLPPGTEPKERPSPFSFDQPPTAHERIETQAATPAEQAISKTLSTPNVSVPAPLTRAAVKGAMSIVPGIGPGVAKLVPDSVTEGLSEAARENWEGQTSLEGLAALPYMVVGGAEASALRGMGGAAKAVATGFTVIGAEQTVEAGKAFAQAVSEGDTQQIVKTGGQALTAAAMTGLGALGLKGRTVEWIPESRQLMAPRINMPEFTESTLEPGGPPRLALPAPGESTATFATLPESPLGPRTEGYRITLPVEPETAKLARQVWSKPIDVEAQVEGADALRQLVSFTDEVKTPGKPYEPPAVNVDLRQLEKQLQKNTVSSWESWADKVVKEKMSGLSANPYFDPEFLAAAAVKGAILVKRGIVNLAEWSSKMREQFGPGIEDHLKPIFDQSMRYFTSEEQKSKPKDTAPPKSAPAAPPVIEAAEAKAAPPLLSAESKSFLQGVASADETQPGIGTWLKGLAGESLPRTTAIDRMSGEAGVRWASSHVAAPYASKFFHETVLQGGVDPVRFGAALTEDNLRSIREAFVKAGEQERAQAVGSLVGQKGSPFTNEEAYQAYLKRPDVQAAIKRHVAMWDEHVEPMYKQAASIDPETELPSRGLQTGARVNLFVPRETDIPSQATASSRPNLTATFQRKSPFARQAKGTGDYGVDYRDMMSNTYARQLDIANQNAFNKQLVASGNAVVGPAGQRPIIKGESTTAFPLKRTQFVTKTEDGTSRFSQSQNIYVRDSMAKEYLAVSNPFGAAGRGTGILSKINGKLNKAALAGLTDFTVHLSNLATVLFTRPASGNVMADTLLSAMGRADIPLTIVKAIKKGFSNNTKQLAELAKIGTLRQHGSTWFTGKIIEWADQTVRLTLDDTYQQLAKKGMVENSETARREFINQVGQYNKRLQGELVRTLRDTGVSPFITAGRTFNTLGIRNVMMDPGLRGGSALTRAQVAAKWAGTVGLLGVLNYLLTAHQGGGVMGRPGVSLGRLDTGMVDEDGRPLTLPFLDIVGFGRGLRVTGIRATVDALRNGLPLQVALDGAVRDTVNSAIGPVAGPPVRFAVGAASGQGTGVKLPRQYPVVPPGENQFFSDFSHALGEANPIIGSIIDLNRSGGSASAALARQLPRFTLQPSRAPEMMENYQEIVKRAQLYTYTDDLIHRARRMKSSQRSAYVQDELAKLPDEDRAQVEQALRYRKVDY